VSEPIHIPPSLLIGRDLSDRIDEHNARVERIWLTVGSRCKPYQAPSAVPAGLAVPSRVPAVEHGGSATEVHP
jgi:hypothetical protein